MQCSYDPFTTNFSGKGIVNGYEYQKDEAETERMSKNAPKFP